MENAHQLKRVFKSMILQKDTLDSKIIRALEIIRIKKHIPNAVL